MGLPYYKAYPRDFIEGTIGMPLELKGAYRLVIDLIYMQGGELPDDARYISGLLGCTVRKWNAIRAELLSRGKIQVSGGLLTNYRAVIELETLRKLQEKQRENGSKPKQNNSLGQAMAEQTRDYPEPEPIEKEETIVSSKADMSPVLVDDPQAAEPDPPPKPKPKRGTSITESWKPDERDVAHAASKNFTADEIKDMADGFRDYHLSRGTTLKDWNAGWRTWVGNARKFGSRGPSGKNGTAGGRQEDPLVLAAMRNASARQSPP